MTPSTTQDRRFVDKVTEETYRVVWMGDRMVLLESDNLLQILTTTSVLKAYYEPLVIVPQQTPFKVSEGPGERHKTQV